MANLAGSLFEKKRIKTTHVKAKAAQQFVEKLITLAKKDTLHARRIVLSRVRHKSVMQTLFNEVAPNYIDRNGGYTRVIRLGQRPGDGAEVSILELVGYEEAMKKKAKEKKEKEAKKEEKKKEAAAPVEAATEEKVEEVEETASEAVETTEEQSEEKAEEQESAEEETETEKPKEKS